MPSVEPWQLEGSDGETIFGNTHRPDGTDFVGEVILCHGFKGYMDYGFLPELAEVLAQQNVLAHRFNFSHSGVTRDFEAFAKPELFERDTWMRQVHDLTQVVEQCTKPDRPLAIFGHSRGGVTALLTAARLGERVNAVVTAAAPADACRLEDAQKRMLKKHGRMESPSGRTGQTLYVGRDWLEQIEADPQAHDPLKAAIHLPGSLLVLHGSADETVPADDARRYLDARPDAEMRIIDGANHVFNAPNPLLTNADLPPQTAEMFDEVFEFLGPTFGVLWS